MGNVNGLVSNKNRPLKDFKGQKLCESCWNGFHFDYATRLKACDYHKEHREESPNECADCKWVKTSQKVTNCLGNPCECNCREMLAENHSRPKLDKSLQSVIDTGDDVISIGTPSHRDDA